MEQFGQRATDYGCSALRVMCNVHSSRKLPSQIERGQTIPMSGMLLDGVSFKVYVCPESLSVSRTLAQLRYGSVHMVVLCVIWKRKIVGKLGRNSNCVSLESVVL